MKKLPVLEKINNIATYPSRPTKHLPGWAKGLVRCPKLKHFVIIFLFMHNKPSLDLGRDFGLPKSMLDNLKKKKNQCSMKEN